MAVGTCINSTGETILVYGPKSLETPQDKDNALYRRTASRKTPDDWDCDGIYVPSDRIAEQVIGSDISGSVAIEYVAPLTFEIEKNGDKYDLPPNQGAFKSNEVCSPSNYLSLCMLEYSQPGAQRTIRISRGSQSRFCIKRTEKKLDRDKSRI